MGHGCAGAVECHRHASAHCGFAAARGQAQACGAYIRLPGEKPRIFLCAGRCGAYVPYGAAGGAMDPHRGVGHGEHGCGYGRYGIGTSVGT